MTYKEQLETVRFIASALKCRKSGVKIPEKNSDISWRMIYAVAKDHSVINLTFSLFGEKVKEDDPELYSKWTKDSLILSARHIAQKNEFSEITRIFSENEIHFLPLKGFLLKKLYPSPEQREMNDLDILVTGDDFYKASQLLLGLGYTKEDEQKVHDSFLKPPFIEIELHKMLRSDCEDFRVTDTSSAPDNKYSHVFSDEDSFVFFLHHAKKHNESGGCGIRTIFDFFLLTENGIPTSEMRLEREGILDFYKNIKSLSDFWFLNESPDDKTLDFELFTVTGGTYGSLENRISAGIEQDGKKYILRRVFPPFCKMKERYKFLKNLPILLPVMYIWRLVVSLFNGSIFRSIKAMNANKKNKKKISEYKNSEMNK